MYIFTSDKHKTLEKEDDFFTQVITLNNAMNKNHRNCAVFKDLFYFVSELKTYLL